MELVKLFLEHRELCLKLHNSLCSNPEYKELEDMQENLNILEAELIILKALIYEKTAQFLKNNAEENLLNQAKELVHNYKRN